MNSISAAGNHTPPDYVKPAGMDSTRPSTADSTAAAQAPPAPRGAEFVHETPESPGYYQPDAERDSGIQFEKPTCAAAPVTSDPHRGDPADGSGEPPEKPAAKMRCSTDAVDQEIERLQRRVETLEGRIRNAAPDDQAKVEQELAAARRELALKDNDSYRRQHAQFTEVS